MCFYTKPYSNKGEIDTLGDVAGQFLSIPGHFARKPIRTRARMHLNFTGNVFLGPEVVPDEPGWRG